MAFHHVVLFCTIIFLWYMFVNAQDSMDKKNYLVSEKTRQLLIPSMRARKISQRAFQDLDLLSARSYGKRASDCMGGMCSKRFKEFSAARLYGKRDADMSQLKYDADMSQLKCLLFRIDCEEEMENTMRNTDYSSMSRYNKFRRDQEIVLPD